MKQKSPRAKIVREVKATNRKFTRKFNNDVDTNLKVQGIKLDKPAQKLKDAAKKDSDDDLDIELYTVKHRDAAQDIHDMITKYLKKRGVLPDNEPRTVDGVIH